MASKTLYSLAILALAISSGYSIRLPQTSDAITAQEAQRLFSQEQSPNAAGSCKDYTLDKCVYELDGVLETIKDIGEANCQTYCELIFHDRCTFFIYDRKQKVCNLMGQTVQSYIDTCKKIGGPNAPSIDDCTQDTDPCNAFLEGYCQLQGSLLEHLEGIENEMICQIACFLLPSCNYFIYDSDLDDCEMFDSSERSCDLIRGPPTPRYDTCFETPTTSTSGPTSTTTRPNTTTPRPTPTTTPRPTPTTTRKPTPTTTKKPTTTTMRPTPTTTRKPSPATTVTTPTASTAAPTKPSTTTKKPVTSEASTPPTSTPITTAPITTPTTTPTPTPASTTTP